MGLLLSVPTLKINAMEKKGLDRHFMDYGIRENDINIIEQVCEDHEVDSAWLEEFVLKSYQTKKNGGVVAMIGMALCLVA